MEATLQLYDCSWCGHPVTVRNGRLSKHLDANNYEARVWCMGGEMEVPNVGERAA